MKKECFYGHRKGIHLTGDIAVIDVYGCGHGRLPDNKAMDFGCARLIGQALNIVSSHTQGQYMRGSIYPIAVCVDQSP